MFGAIGVRKLMFEASGARKVTIGKSYLTMVAKAYAKFFWSCYVGLACLERLVSESLCLKRAVPERLP